METITGLQLSLYALDCFLQSCYTHIKFKQTRWNNDSLFLQIKLEYAAVLYIYHTAAPLQEKYQ